MNTEEKETIDSQEEQAQETQEGNETVENSTEENEPINEWEDKYNEVNDRYLRLYSEFENFRKRTAKEKLDLIQNASEGVISNLIPVLDDMERAVAANKDSADIEAVKEGMDLVFQKLSKTLEQKGLKPMEVNAGDDFDVDLHEAITKIPAPDKNLKGKIVDAVEKGYFLNEKVIRYSKVVIGE